MILNHIIPYILYAYVHANWNISSILTAFLHLHSIQIRNYYLYAILPTLDRTHNHFFFFYFIFHSSHSFSFSLTLFVAKTTVFELRQPIEAGMMIVIIIMLNEWITMNPKKIYIYFIINLIRFGDENRKKRRRSTDTQYRCPRIQFWFYFIWV